MLSPFLFSPYVADMPTKNDNTHLTKYVEDTLLIELQESTSRPYHKVKQTIYTRGG